MENIKINITSNGTTTLATAGKYCERNVDIDVLVSGGGGGSSFLDNEGSLFMTADEEAFCVDGNDRMVDVTEFPEKPLDNVVYKKGERKVVSDGQINYETEITTYGIPSQTDHSSGLLHKNVEIHQYLGEGEPQAWTYVNNEMTDIVTFYNNLLASVGQPPALKGYKVVNTRAEATDSSYIYLVWETGEIGEPAGSVNDVKFNFTKFPIIEDKADIEGMTTGAMYFGAGWRSITPFEKLCRKYAKELDSLAGAISGRGKTVESETLTEVSKNIFNGNKNLKSFKCINVETIRERAFYWCSYLEYVDTSATSIWSEAFQYCGNLVTFVLRGGKCSIETTTFADCKKLLNGGSGYIYVPLDLIDSYKADTNFATVKDQIMPYCKKFSEIYTLDTTKYTHAFYDEKEWVHDGTQWVEYTR